jgi:hypothetical protein
MARISHRVLLFVGGKFYLKFADRYFEKWGKVFYVEFLMTISHGYFLMGEGIQKG